MKAEQDVAVMTPRGYINGLGAERLEETSEQMLENGLKNLVVNFSEVQFINTIGISIFTGIIHKTQQSRGTLCFTNMKKIHRDVFELMGLMQHVQVFKDEDEALAFLDQREGNGR
jgi:anti-anti-sigma factor